ncbi:MAG TPA: M20 family peptidase [Pyrinomonadaceae bacterium]|nr:M20 family peptidase [Pyrinomonadaceae bacterium]
MKKIILGLTLLIAILLVVLLINTFSLKSRQVSVTNPYSSPLVDPDATTRLAGAIRFKTVSDQKPEQENSQQFLAFREYLRQVFPKTHATLNEEVIGGHSQLFTWKGRDDSLKPILFAAHLDVVPVESSSEKDWAYPPFDGQVSDGFVWGRGTIDDKSGVLALLEAVEFLLNENFQPSRTVYLAFGHDEEVGGKHGAAAIAAVLASRSVQFEYVLDEGSLIVDGLIPGISKPIALIGIAEKGFLSLQLQVNSNPGHSAVPPEHTAIGVLSQAINRLEENQMPGHLSGVMRETFEYLGPEMPWSKKLIFANLWLFRPLLERELSTTPATNASLRTTLAVTMIEGGVKENVLPAKASAVINLRILPGDTMEGVTAYVHQIVNDERVKISRFGDDANEPSAISEIESKSFTDLQQTIRQVFPEVLVAPALVLGATDSRHYQPLTRNVFRFQPYIFTESDLLRIHGVNERIQVEGYKRSITFYCQLIKTSANVATANR